MSLVPPFGLPSPFNSFVYDPDTGLALDEPSVISPFRFILCPVLSNVPFAEIELSNVKFTQSVDGTGTTLEGDAFLSDAQDADKLKSILNYPNDPKAIAVYVLYEDQYLWGGVLQARPWDKSARAFKLSATSWKAWLYQRFLGPNISTNPVTDVSYGWTNVDQFVIAQQIVGYATAGNGTPTINVGTETSGINRDLNFFGSEFIYAGEAIDRMANRDKGFEWDIEIRGNNQGRPDLYFVPYYPKKQGVNTSVLFKSTEFGGNITTYTSPDDTSENVITRVWGTGSGASGVDLLMAYDQDPGMGNDVILLVESKEYANSSTVEIATVASHAQGIRAFHASGLQQVTVTVPLDDPLFTDYSHGDKVRVLIQDDVLDIDFQSVRIVRRTFSVNASGATPKEDSVELLIDLNDTSLPEDETAL